MICVRPCGSTRYKAATWLLAVFPTMSACVRTELATCVNIAFVVSIAFLLHTRLALNETEPTASAAAAAGRFVQSVYLVTYVDNHHHLASSVTFFAQGVHSHLRVCKHTRPQVQTMVHHRLGASTAVDTSLHRLAHRTTWGLCLRELTWGPGRMSQPTNPSSQ
jgi:hypothetical protein